MTTYAEALQIEREGYARRGLDDRVAQVDAEIERVNAAEADDSEEAELVAVPETAEADQSDVERAVEPSPRRGRGRS